jgi:hypothetical protein
MAFYCIKNGANSKHIFLSYAENRIELNFQSERKTEMLEYRGKIAYMPQLSHNIASSAPRNERDSNSQ